MPVLQRSALPLLPALLPILDRGASGQGLSPEDGLTLLYQTEPESIAAIREAADQLRRDLVGETVTYVVNRNINFTNICEQHCSFCAFREDATAPEAYWLSHEVMLSKAQDAVDSGATEICMQGGLNPEAKIQGQALPYYCTLLSTLKTQFPNLHLHAFSPQEVQFMARQDGLSYETVIGHLRDAGLGSMPGTAAEVLDDGVRRILCPEKINTATWLEIIETAHRLGVPTTSTLLSGHIETPEQQLSHLQHLRSVQERAEERNYPARITEFILLPFVGQFAPAPLRRRVGRDQPDSAAALKLTAVVRLFLGHWIPNHQPSWVKLGLDVATEALTWGCNDLGGTLMEEHITSKAGAQGGTTQTVESLRQAIEGLQRPAAQRDTLYRLFNGGMNRDING
jgi:5-amino-6-(D-ribitylamino)uracil---L-tyrosine 4-hydroxyphenyl transferase